MVGKKELLKIYGTTNATAIKLEILWVHIQALMGVHFPCDKPGTPNHRAMQQYKQHWQYCKRKSPR